MSTSFVDQDLPNYLQTRVEYRYLIDFLHIDNNYAADKLYESITDLKKDVKDLKKEVKDLKNEFKEFKDKVTEDNIEITNKLDKVTEDNIEINKKTRYFVAQYGSYALKGYRLNILLYH